LTDKKGIPLSAVITSASTHDIKAATDVMDNAVIRKQEQSTPSNPSTKTKTTKQHLCLDRAYSSKAVEQEITNRGYAPHMPYKRKRGGTHINEKEKDCQKRHHPRRRRAVERTNSWHNRFRKPFTRYEKKAKNYHGLLQLSCSIIIYRKIILG
jgi:transposase